MVALVIIYGILIGLVASMPIGAVAIMTIQRTINRGAFSGFIVGLAAALIDVFYASIALLGLTFIKNFILGHEKILGIIGGSFLIFSGFKMVEQKTLEDKRMKEKLSKLKLANDFLTGLVIAGTNPITILGFGGFFAMFGVQGLLHSKWENLIFILSILVGAILWWLSLTFSVSYFRNKISEKTLQTINKIIGAVIILLGTAFVFVVLLKH